MKKILKSLVVVGATVLQVCEGDSDCDGVSISRTPTEADRLKYEWAFMKKHVLNQSETHGRRLPGIEIDDWGRNIQLPSDTVFALTRSRLLRTGGAEPAPLPALGPGGPNGAPAVPVAPQEPADGPPPVHPDDWPPERPPPLVYTPDVREGHYEPGEALHVRPVVPDVDFEEPVVPFEMEFGETRELADGCLGCGGSSRLRRLQGGGCSGLCNKVLDRLFRGDSTLSQEEKLAQLAEENVMTDKYGATAAYEMKEDGIISADNEAKTAARIAQVGEGDAADVSEVMTIFGSALQALPGIGIVAGVLMMIIPMTQGPSGPNLEKTWKVLEPLVQQDIKKAELQEQITTCHNAMHDVYHSGVSLLSKQYFCEPQEYNTTDVKFQRSFKAVTDLRASTTMTGCSTKDLESANIGAFGVDYHFYKNSNLGSYLALVTAQFQQAYKWALVNPDDMSKVKINWQSHYRTFYLEWILSTGTDSFVSQYMRYRVNASSCTYEKGQYCWWYGNVRMCRPLWWTYFKDNTGYNVSTPTSYKKSSLDANFCNTETAKLRHRIRMEVMLKVNRLLKYAASTPLTIFDNNTKSHGCLSGGRGDICAPVPKSMDSGDDEEFFDFSWRKFTACTFWQAMQDKYGTKYGNMYNLDEPVDDPMFKGETRENFTGKQLHCRDMGNGKIELVPMRDSCDTSSFIFLGLDGQRSLCTSWSGCFLDPVKNTCHTVSQALSVASRYSFCAENSSTTLPEYPITCQYTNNTSLKWTDSKELPRLQPGPNETREEVCRKNCLADKECQMFSVTGDLLCTLHYGNFQEATFLSQLDPDQAARALADELVSGLADPCLIPGAITVGTNLPSSGTYKDVSGCKEQCKSLDECVAYTYNSTSQTCDLLATGYSVQGIHVHTMVDSNIGDIPGVVSANLECYK
uniref:Apple domain-containing protein n=1 Tax=Mucochytrium quahogii TaxID=96639 RepID=A0A7S2SCP0_9STRA|mmetsp:Transcript_7126/g.12714  ORF Transcript_7126/g.12714 Transcript_7126/m.12714 type:complete len:914 (+) Transcript_7126:607-3348(+)|eukprot:CAMPEP_0203764102 /NCGR_PEP_ID=MMETSP0098-20131031/17420_1 /ASSEMBLY_ACC=CAM_ASM_000208 /TAXON_ID=96639 /ORGANISM=" , Strain NY0313808BC1" /LENGTH=913 /DNA_ID=CAMNT_0050659791 /DNA_START=503 /DNA_END=3244 /DNA_ORIENTATION=+